MCSSSRGAWVLQNQLPYLDNVHMNGTFINFLASTSSKKLYQMKYKIVYEWCNDLIDWRSRKPFERFYYFDFEVVGKRESFLLQWCAVLSIAPYYIGWYALLFPFPKHTYILYERVNIWIEKMYATFCAILRASIQLLPKRRTMVQVNLGA